MNPARERANVFTIAPDVSFLATFAAALFDGRIVPGFSRDSDAFEIARATIFVPTQRARRALVTALSEAAGSATLLPRIAALGALDEAGDQAEQGGDGVPATLAIPPAIGALERRLLLTQLVHRWAQSLPGAIVLAHATGFDTDDTQSLLVGNTPADAFALAGALGALIDEFIIEGIDPRALGGLVEAEHDPYWRITTRFLEIAFEAWPNMLADRGLIDAARRRVRFADEETARLAAGGTNDPLIVLGSTGTNDATARLMAAICRLPNGAVVLPGLDKIMSDAVFANIGLAGDGAEEPGFGHPQAALKRLLTTLRVARSVVIELGPATPSSRMNFLSDALLPAEATDVWPQSRERHAPQIAEALENIALLEASDEREEALAIAVRLREVVATPTQTAALITPDRALARRVRAELTRWSVAVDDSAGIPLSSTPRAVLARLALTAADEKTDAATLAVLSHAHTFLGRERQFVARLARYIDIGVFRAKIAPDDVAKRIVAAKDAALRRHAHRAIRAIAADEWDAMAALLRDLQAALAPLHQGDARKPLATWIELHRATLATIAGPSTSDADAALDALFDDPALFGGALVLDLADYRVLFDRLAATRTLSGAQGTHPRVKILGLLEARLLHADVVILAGLDEAIWPPVAQTDPFLNRPMRTMLGLTPPERRIGQTAHDFWMAMGAPEILLTRAKKRGGSPTTPSRFLRRIMALAGDASDPARARGENYARLARRLDTPREDERQRLQPPQPKPPVDLRPKRLSVTRIETWIRDPYAIYAERILELTPVGALDEPPGYAEQGTAIHNAIEWAAKEFGMAPLPADAASRLEEEGSKQLAALDGDASWQTFRRPRQMGGLRYFLAYHAARQPLLAFLFAEVSGQWDITLHDGSTFTLTCKADRIEVARDGTVRIVDFKTGSLPEQRDITGNLAPQLTLEAAMIAEGAFNEISARDVTDALYIKLGSRDGGEQKFLAVKDMDFPELVAHHRALLHALVERYRDPEQAYLSQPIAKYAPKYSDYVHLSRVKEWSATSGLRDDDFVR